MGHTSFQVAGIHARSKRYARDEFINLSWRENVDTLSYL